MLDEKLFIPVLLGTNREGRASENPARWIFDEVSKREDMETMFFDARDFALPQDDYGQATKEQFGEYRDAIVRADGLIIVAPEYNHGYPGRLKSVLDILLPEYLHKAAGVAGVSAGPWGGVRMIENLVPVLRELGLVVIKKSLQFPMAGKSFTEEGKPTEEEAARERLETFLAELAWMSRALRWGRHNL